MRDRIVGMVEVKVHCLGGRKSSLEHTSKGLLRFEHASFQSKDDPALKLVIYTPA